MNASSHTNRSILNIDIDGMSCGHCLGHIRSALASVAGVEVLELGLGSARISVPDAATADAAAAAILEAGYAARVTSPEPDETPAGRTGCFEGGSTSSSCSA